MPVKVLNSENTPLVKSPSFLGDGSVSDVIDKIHVECRCPESHERYTLYSCGRLRFTLYEIRGSF